MQYFLTLHKHVYCIYFSIIVNIRILLEFNCKLNVYRINKLYVYMISRDSFFNSEKCRSGREYFFLRVVSSLKLYKVRKCYSKFIHKVNSAWLQRFPTSF